MTEVYTFSNTFLKEAQQTHLRLRHAGLCPYWGKWKDGQIPILLDEDDTRRLRQLQEENPAMYGNNPEWKDRKQCRILRDGEIQTIIWADEVMDWFHQQHNFSMDWALKHEGYTVEEIG